ncbi:MAG: RecQ family zinc-binding domain-containing protein, partial [Bacteroides sp.]|nr:RecQ family zinc-binding domain-containing protein [Bacteroides sp.]
DELYKLRELGEEMDKLIQIVLRSYTGVFTDYVFINEDTLAVRSGLTRRQVYNLLIQLSRMHIIHYIPHKKTPYIIYTRERVDTCQLNIPRMAYEERKERYEARIEAMIDYVTNETSCRSRMLLRYFGEKNEHNCGICDTCLSYRAKEKQPQATIEELRGKVLQALEEQPGNPAELAQRITADKEALLEAIQQLLEEKKIHSVNGILQTV